MKPPSSGCFPEHPFEDILTLFADTVLIINTEGSMLCSHQQSQHNHNKK